MAKSTRNPSGVRLPWTFSLWLTFQRKRQDAVGITARVEEKDGGWPGWHDQNGLEEYLREQGAGEETLRGLHVAYAEWEAWTAAKEGGEKEILDLCFFSLEH